MARRRFRTKSHPTIAGATIRQEVPSLREPSREKKCKTCTSKFVARLDSRQLYCTPSCKAKAARAKTTRSDLAKRGDVGALGELSVTCDLLAKGWSVFRSVSPHAHCDLIATKGNKIKRIEVRTGTLLRNGTVSFCNGYQPFVTTIAVWVRNTGKITYRSASKVGICKPGPTFRQDQISLYKGRIYNGKNKDY